METREIEIVKNHPEYCKNQPFYVSVQHTVSYWVNCLDRTLIVAYNGNTDEDEVYSILDERYRTWSGLEDCEGEDEYNAIFFSCCEEYMLEGLDDLDIVYFPIYVDDSDDD